MCVRAGAWRSLCVSTHTCWCFSSCLWFWEHTEGFFQALISGMSVYRLSFSYVPLAHNYLGEILIWKRRLDVLSNLLSEQNQTETLVVFPFCVCYWNLWALFKMSSSLRSWKCCTVSASHLQGQNGSIFCQGDWTGPVGQRNKLQLSGKNISIISVMINSDIWSLVRKEISWVKRSD